jgi:hypothetical protein
MAPFDAVHMLGHVVFSEAQIDPETYKESEHPAAAFVAEMVAADLLVRPGRAGTSEITPAIDAHVSESIRRLCREAVHLESIRRMLAAGGLSTPESSARARAARHHLMLRGPGWPWQEHETLRGLFGAERFAVRLRAVLGFDVEDAIACSEALPHLVLGRMETHMVGARESAVEFGEGHPAYRWATTALQGWREVGPEHMRALAITALWALNHIGDVLLLDEGALATAAAIDPTLTAAYFSRLSLAPGQADDDWFRLAEAVRLRPFIDYGADGYMPTVVGNELWALRGVFERALATNEGYTRHRGRWLERRAGELLARPLAPEHVHFSVDFEYDDDGKQIEGEIDALLVCGDTAIVIEAKGATMRPGARRGGEAFINHLRENITKASEQGARAIRALAEPGSIRKDGVTIELPTVREVHPIVVTLDDLSSAAPVLWQFQGTRVMPEGVTIPWVVTLYELDLVASSIEWPAQFMHFLRRRSRVNQLGHLVASDELDWWMHYLLIGLYFEDEDHDEPIRLLSHTDPLDAWVLYERGMRTTPAEKPSMRLDKTSRAFLDLLCEERPPAWISAACMLLDISTDARKKLWKAIDKVRPLARQRRRPQRCTFGFQSAPDPMMICAVVLPNENRDRLSDALEELVETRVDEHGFQRVLGIAVTGGSRRPYEALGVLDRKWRTPPDAPVTATVSTTEPD